MGDQLLPLPDGAQRPPPLDGAWSTIAGRFVHPSAGLSSHLNSLDGGCRPASFLSRVSPSWRRLGSIRDPMGRRIATIALAE